MSGAEIIKALEELKQTCFKNGSIYNHIELALSLINRQRAEIERLQTGLTIACAERNARICTADFFKAEAIQEFAKMLIDKSENGVIHISDLPDYVKETLGEGSNSPLVDKQN